MQRVDIVSVQSKMMIKRMANFWFSIEYLEFYSKMTLVCIKNNEQGSMI